MFEPNYKHYYNKKNRLIATIAYYLTAKNEVIVGIARADHRQKEQPVTKALGREIASLRLFTAMGLSIVPSNDIAHWKLTENVIQNKLAVMMSPIQFSKTFIDGNPFLAGNCRYGKNPNTVQPAVTPVKLKPVTRTSSKTTTRRAAKKSA